MTTIDGIQTKTLELDTYGIAWQLANELFIKPELIGPRMDGLLNQFLTVGFKGHMWGEKVGEKSIEYPASWLEHTKKALGLKYKKAKATFTFKAMYPDFKVLPQLGRASMQVAIGDYEPPFTKVEDEWRPA
jgi:hypothetical protein